jgi:Arc/MetJ-type ribon-helix-helix transcriptional regulator
MTVQIAVRLDEELVAQVDALVQSGAVRSRAQIVASALERELRRRLYERDVEVLLAERAKGGADEFEDLDAWVARNRPPVD